jgi:hypothetical protein
MQADHLAANTYKVLPRLLERVNETEPRQGAFVSVPTARMTRAALLNGWPVSEPRGVSDLGGPLGAGNEPTTRVDPERSA